MATFDFVTDDDLRESLESDARELAHCLEGGAAKAAHVLAGSIVEAVLADHLIAIGYVDASGRDILELDLGQLIAAAKSKKAISPRTADLASVVKSYRNLIHPGRLARLKERVGPSTAAIANSLVEVVADEVSAQKRTEYGYTAQQIVNKLEVDSSALAVMPALLSRTSAKEQERLLIAVLPKRYLELAADDFTDRSVLARFGNAYRSTFEATDDPIRQRVSARYVEILKEGAELEVTTHESAFFQADDLAFMSAEDGDVARRHLIAQVGERMTRGLARALTGIGAHIEPSEIGTVVDSAVKYAAGRTDAGRWSVAREVLLRLWREIPSGPDAAVPKRLADWESWAATRDNKNLKDWIAEIRAGMFDLEDIPF